MAEQTIKIELLTASEEAALFLGAHRNNFITLERSRGHRQKIQSKKRRERGVSKN